MSNVYVLCQDYPSGQNKYAMAFIHPRVKVYQSNGIATKVISFSCKEDYVYDGVQVYTVNSGIKKLKESFENILISHAPNLKNHIPFIFKIRKYVRHLILFFHGHEVLSTKDYYPRPYNFNKKAQKEYRLLRVYDLIKLPFMSLVLSYFLRSRKCDLIFVSQWMVSAATKSLCLDFKSYPNVHIINNGINQFIKEGSYFFHNKKADFITIRPLDQSKYAIDLVVSFAKSHPSSVFHIYGKGDYFKYNEKPDNIFVFSDFLLPKDIPIVLNSYKYALMPTRLDAQGVMMCEMVVHGIPTIVSDLEVCHEMLDDYSNVIYLDNENFDCSLCDISNLKSKPNYKFSDENTIYKEIRLLQNIFQ